MKHITPTHAAHAAACLHTWHLECFGDPARKLPPDAMMLDLRERGLEHERRLVATLEGVESPAWDGKDYAQGCTATLDLMRRGAAWIYQGVLASDGVRGKPDLLQKTEAGYLPVDVKSHKGVKASDGVQLAVYAAMMGHLTGSEPKVGRIWDAQGKLLDVDLAGMREDRDALLARMASVAEGNAPTEPLRCGSCKACPWLDVCSESWIQGTSLTLVRKADRKTVLKLKAAGIGTVKELLADSPEDLARKAGLKVERARFLQLHARASAEGRPLPRKKAKFPSGVPVYFYDIETYQDLAYLHGAIRLEGGKREEQSFLAERPEDAGKAWADFLGWISRDREAVVYTWTAYENAFVEDCRRRFGADAGAFGRLKGSLVDLKAWVEAHWALPVHDYSIKVVAPVFGFAWQAEDAGGLNSVRWYEEWLRTGDQTLRTKLVEYNLDDVRAMERIYERLQAGA